MKTGKAVKRLWRKRRGINQSLRAYAHWCAMAPIAGAEREAAQAWLNAKGIVWGHQ